MPQGLEVFGPNGESWLLFNESCGIVRGKIEIKDRDGNSGTERISAMSGAARPFAITQHTKLSQNVGNTNDGDEMYTYQSTSGQARFSDDDSTELNWGAGFDYRSTGSFMIVYGTI